MQCNFGECLMELFIQLAIIMIGKQTLNAVIEYGVPKIKAYMARRKSQDDNEENIRTDSMKQWVEDLKLSGLDSKGMFSEYLEMGKLFIYELLNTIRICIYVFHFIQLTIIENIFFLDSYPIWVCYHLCNCVSTGTSIRFDKQHIRDATGCKEICEILSSSHQRES